MASPTGPDGRPIRQQDIAREIARATVTGLRSPWHESVASGLTPPRLARILRGAAEGEAMDYLTLAEEMEERELHYASVLGTRKRAVLGLARSVEAATDDAHAVMLADAVRDQLVNRPAFGRLVSAALDALGKGYSVCEIGWDTRRKPWVPRDRYLDGRKVRAYEWRDPRFFFYDRDSGRELRLLDETDLLQGLPLPTYKFIVHEPQLKQGLPIRAGLARLVALAYMCSAYTLQDWMSFADVFGLPLRVGRYGPGANDDDIKTLINAVANLGSDAAAVLPESMRIDFQSAVQGAGSPDLFKNLSEHLHNLISKAVLGQTETVDATPGRLGAATEKQEVRQDILESDCEDLANTLNEQLIQPFIDLNWGPQDAYPTFRFYIPDDEDLTLLVTALEKLVPLGLKVEQSVIRDKLGLPDPEPDADILVATAPPAEPVMNRRALNQRRGLLPDQQALEDLLEDIEAGELAEQGEDLLQPLLALIRREGPDQALTQLAEAYPAMNADDLQELLARVMFVGQIWGRLQGAHG